jgi:hypothetical protein
MKKRLLAIAFLILLLVLLSACPISTIGSLPYGKWESADPNIVMDINPQYEEFQGIYYVDGEVINLYITFPYVWKQFEIYDYSDKINLLQPGSYELALFNGDYSLRSGKLRYKLKPYWQEKSGITHTIIFEKTEEYEIPAELLKH